MRRTYIRGGHTNGENIHTGRTYTQKDIYTKRTYTWRNTHIKGHIYGEIYTCRDRNAEETYT